MFAITFKVAFAWPILNTDKHAGVSTEDNFMRVTILTLSIMAFATSNAHAEDHGHIAVQIKTPPAGCKYLKLNFIDAEGKKYSPNGNTIGMSEIAKGEEKKTFTDIHKFHVKPGRYTLKSIRCINFKKKKMSTTINFEASRKSQLPAAITYSNLVFDMAEDKTIYMGALDFVPFGRENTWPLALDRSEAAVAAGRLDAGGFTKQFVTMTGDIARAKKATESTPALDGALSNALLPASSLPSKPPSGGKGKIAVHYKGSRCGDLLVFFKNIDTPDTKNVKIEIKKTYKNGEGFASEKVPSGRYEFKYTKCITGNRFKNAPALAKSFVDVHPDEIAYAGEIHMKETLAPSVNNQIQTKYRYIFNNDKFAAAKSELKNSKRLVDRSATMTDTAQLAVTGIENYLQRSNAKWSAVLAAYDTRRAEYAGEVIP